MLEGCGDMQKVLMINTGEGVMGIPPPGRGHSRLQGGMGLSTEIGRLMEAQQDHRQET